MFLCKKKRQQEPATEMSEMQYFTGRVWAHDSLFVFNNQDFLKNCSQKP